MYDKKGIRRRTCALLLAVLGFVPKVRAYDINAHNKLNFTNDLNYYDNTVHGSNPTGSFLTPGHFAVDDLGALHNYVSTATGVSWETAVDARETDDPRIESRQDASGVTHVARFQLKRFYSKYKDEKNELVLGDFLGALTPYTMSASLKGGQYKRKVTDHIDLVALSGIQKPNWDDLWNNNLTETVDRKFYGARASMRFLKDGAVGINAIGSVDSRATFNTTANLVNNQITSVDWTVPSFQNVALSGESAWAHTWTEFASKANNVGTSQQGWAHLVKGEYSLKRFRTQDEFERVSPNFATTGGAASPDLVRVRTANQYKVSSFWRLLANYSWFHNNLAKTGFTSTTQLPEVGVRYEGPDWRPTLSVESKFRDREVTSTNNGVRDITRGAVNSVSDRIGPVDATVDYEFQREAKSDASAADLHHILGVGASYSKLFKNGYRVAPNVRYSVQRDRNELIGKTDQATIMTGNLTVSAPWGLTANGGYNRNLAANAVNPGSDRRTWNASLGYNILKNPDWHIEGKFLQNDNRFTTAAQDFKETVASVILKLKI